jgi:hypothetical protein
VDRNHFRFAVLGLMNEGGISIEHSVWMQRGSRGVRRGMMGMVVKLATKVLISEAWFE